MEREKAGLVEIHQGRIEVRCSGEMAAWDVWIGTRGDPEVPGMRVNLNLSEMAELLQLCVRTGRVLPAIARDNLLGAVCSALPELHPGFKFRIEKGS